MKLLFIAVIFSIFIGQDSTQLVTKKHNLKSQNVTLNKLDSLDIKLNKIKLMIDSTKQNKQRKK